MVLVGAVMELLTMVVKTNTLVLLVVLLTQVLVVAEQVHIIVVIQAEAVVLDL